MERHVYKFEFKYHKQVNGKKTEFTVPVIVHDECYVDACTKVDEFVKKNFADRVTEESTIKYVGEFIHGVLKPFVEVEKETEKMRTKKKSYEVLEMENGFLDRYVVQLKKVIDGWIEINNKKDCKINELEKRVKEFEEKKRTIKAVSLFVQGSRGSGKTNFETEMFKESKHAEMINEMINTLDVKSLYPSGTEIAEKAVYKQAVDVCKVYRMERDQALKENEILKERIENITKDSEKVYKNLRFTDKENYNLRCQISGYKKELSQLNMLMDDMEDRLEKHVVSRDGMLKQLREYKAEAKRKNKIIDALTEDKDEK